ncbi:MAG: hypothetical protein QOH61_2684 [Chloroflexota bacterium]|jgi:hypothetical protein|nr:hypothetical protein [Chloroflexota bacterium]
MAMDGADWLRTQLTSFGCAACGQAYDPGRIRVLAERDGLFFVDLACAHCGTQAVAVVTIQVDEDDVAHADAGERFDQGVEAAAPAPAVSADDLLSMHAFLSGFEGDVSTFLSRLEGPLHRSGTQAPREAR